MMNRKRPRPMACQGISWFWSSWWDRNCSSENVESDLVFDLLKIRCVIWTWNVSNVSTFLNHRVSPNLVHRSEVFHPLNSACQKRHCLAKLKTETRSALPFKVWSFGIVNSCIWAQATSSLKSVPEIVGVHVEEAANGEWRNFKTVTLVDLTNQWKWTKSRDCLQVTFLTSHCCCCCEREESQAEVEWLWVVCSVLCLWWHKFVFWIYIKLLTH